MDAISTIALAAGLGWASGIWLYATVFVVGLLGRLGISPKGVVITNHGNLNS